MLDNTLAQLLGVDPNTTTGNLALSLANGSQNQPITNANPNLNLSLGGSSAPTAPVAPTAQAQPAPQAPAQGPAVPTQMSPTVAAANGQAPGNPSNVQRPAAPVAPVAPQAMPVSAPAQQAGAPQIMPIPNAQVPNYSWNDYQNPANLPQNQGQMQPVTPAPVQQAPVQQAPQAGAPAAQAPGQTTNNITPQDLLTSQLYNSMLNVESGNKDYNANGTPVTSSAGALFASQVMPSTAANPGFGIKPAQSQTPAEYNRVGKEYFQAMMNRYNDPNQAVAAYNAGPGGVDRAIAQANQAGDPQSWRQYLPAETQAYLAKVNPSAVIAQNAHGGQTQGGMTPVSYSASGNQQYDALIAAGNDPQKLSQIAFDANQPDQIRQAASQSLYDVLSHTQGMADAKNQLVNSLTSGNTMNIDRQARGNTPDASRFRAVLYELAGAKTAAQNEYNQLGANSTWTPATLDNQNYVVYSTPTGEARAAINQSTGEYVTDPTTLNRLNGFGGTVATQAHMMPSVHGSPVINPQTGQTGLIMYDPRSRQQYVQVGNQRVPAQGFVTMAQNPEAVFNKAQAGKQGEVAGATSEFTGGAGAPGAGGYTPPAGGAPGAGGPSPAGIPGAPGVAKPTVSGSTVNFNNLPVETNPTTLAGMKLANADKQDFVKSKQSIIDAGSSAQQTADLRRQQLAILSDPNTPIGAAQGQNNSPVTQMVSDIMAGKYAGHEGELPDDAFTAYNIKPGSQAYNNIKQFANLQGLINASSGQMKAEFGNRVSNMDVQLFTKTAGGDMLRSPAYAQFANNENNTILNDMASAKGDLASSGQYQTNSGFTRAWKAQQAQMEQIVGGVKQARLDYIQTLPGGVSSPANVRAGFQAYPTPIYDTATGTYKLNGATQGAVNQTLNINPDTKAKLDAIRNSMKKPQPQVAPAPAANAPIAPIAPGQPGSLGSGD